MKILLRLLVLCCLVDECNAQDKHQNLSLEGQAGVTISDAGSIFAYGSLGLKFKLNSFFSVGPSVHVMSFQRAEGSCIPVTADILFTPVHGRVQPFVNLQVGKNLYCFSRDLFFSPPNPPDIWKTTGGIFISPNLGVAIPASHRLSIFANLGYVYTKFRSRYSETDNSTVTYHNMDFDDKSVKASAGLSLKL